MGGWAGLGTGAGVRQAHPLQTWECLSASPPQCLNWNNDSGLCPFNPGPAIYTHTNTCSSYTHVNSGNHSLMDNDINMPSTDPALMMCQSPCRDIDTDFLLLDEESPVIIPTLQMRKLELREAALFRGSAVIPVQTEGPRSQVPFMPAHSQADPSTTTGTRSAVYTRRPKLRSSMPSSRLGQGGVEASQPPGFQRL